MTYLRWYWLYRCTTQIYAHIPENHIPVLEVWQLAVVSSSLSRRSVICLSSDLHMGPTPYMSAYKRLHAPLWILFSRVQRNNSRHDRNTRRANSVQQHRCACHLNIRLEKKQRSSVRVPPDNYLLLGGQYHHACRCNFMPSVKPVPDETAFLSCL